MAKCISSIDYGDGEGRKFKNPVDAYDAIKYDMDNNILGGFNINCAEMSYEDRIKLCRWLKPLLCSNMGKIIYTSPLGFKIES